MPTVYLLHFEKPDGKVLHYIGATDRDPEVRFAEHQRGDGGSFTRQLINAGAAMVTARRWATDTRVEAFMLEKKLKGRSAKPLCAICRGLTAGA